MGRPGSRTLWAVPAAFAFAALALQGCLFSSWGGGKGDGPGNAASEFNPVPRGYYAIAFPGSSADLDLDSAYVVRWNASDSAGDGPVRLSIYKNGAFLSELPLDSALPASGAWEWKLPETIDPGGYRLGSGSDYRLRIVGASDSSKWDFGPRFRIHSRYTGSLKLTSPVAGSRVDVNSAVLVSWTVGGDVGYYLGAELYAGKSLVRTITANAIANVNTECYWQVLIAPRPPGDDYHIRVFSVSDPAIEATAPVRIAYSGSYAILSAGPGDTVSAGSNVEADWSVSGSLGELASISIRNESTGISRFLFTVNPANHPCYWTVPGGLSSGPYRLRMTSYPDTGISVYSSAFFVKATDADAYEEDDSLTSAKPIVADGSPQSRTLTPHDTDWIRFEAKTGKRYLARFLPSGNKGPGSVSGTMHLDAFDSSGRFLRAMGGSSSVFSPAYQGTHYLRVSPSFFAQPGPDSSVVYGPYRFSLIEYDSLGSAYPIAFTSPAADTTWNPGKTHSIRWVPDTVNFGYSVFLRLYQDTTDLGLLAAPIANSGAYDWNIPYGFRTGDKFRIRMEPPPYFRSASDFVFAYSPFFTIKGP